LWILAFFALIYSFFSDLIQDEVMSMEEDFKNIGRRVGDIDDLPEELKKHLQISKTDELEEKILSVLNELYSGMANLDEVIVGLYRKYNEIIDNRQFLSNKMYRMSQNKLLYSVMGKKGAYTTKKELVDYFKKN
tara:strand:+ start:1513 stop:1914 length:402 start_codon:yes stop_codon:yes gene_type:complete